MQLSPQQFNSAKVVLPLQRFSDLTDCNARMRSALNTRDEYFDLVLAFPLRPIRSRSVHEKAKTLLRSLTGRRGSAARDYKIILASIIADYERSAHHGLDLSKVTAADIVHHQLSERDMSVNALA